MTSAVSGAEHLNGSVKCNWFRPFSVFPVSLTNSTKQNMLYRGSAGTGRHSRAQTLLLHFQVSRKCNQKNMMKYVSARTQVHIFLFQRLSRRTVSADLRSLLHFTLFLASSRQALTSHIRVFPDVISLPRHYGKTFAGHALSCRVNPKL